MYAPHNWYDPNIDLTEILPEYTFEYCFKVVSTK
jgi:hypothetical protein